MVLTLAPGLELASKAPSDNGVGRCGESEHAASAATEVIAASVASGGKPFTEPRPASAHLRSVTRGSASSSLPDLPARHRRTADTRGQDGGTATIEVVGTCRPSLRPSTAHSTLNRPKPCLSQELPWLSESEAQPFGEAQACRWSHHAHPKRPRRSGGSISNRALLLRLERLFAVLKGQLLTRDENEMQFEAVARSLETLSHQFEEPFSKFDSSVQNLSSRLKTRDADLVDELKQIRMNVDSVLHSASCETLGETEARERATTLRMPGRHVAPLEGSPEQQRAKESEKRTNALLMEHSISLDERANLMLHMAEWFDGAADGLVSSAGAAEQGEARAFASQAQMDAELRLTQSQQDFSEMLSGMRAGSRRLSVLSQQLANTLKLRVEELTGKLRLADEAEAAAAKMAAEEDETVASLRRAQSSVADLTEQLDMSRARAEAAQARASEAGEELLAACAREAAQREVTAQTQLQLRLLSAALEHATAAGASASAEAAKAHEARAEQAEETARVAGARADKADADLRGVVAELRRKEEETQQLQLELERSNQRAGGGSVGVAGRTAKGKDGGDLEQVRERELASEGLREALAQMVGDGLRSGEAVLLKPVLDRLASVENRIGGLTSLVGLVRLETQRTSLSREAESSLSQTCSAALHADAALLCAELANEELSSEAARGEAEQARVAFQDMAASLAWWQERAARAEASALLPSDGQRSMLYKRLQGNAQHRAVATAATDGDGDDERAVALEAARLAGEAAVGARLVGDARVQLSAPSPPSQRGNVLYGTVEWRTAKGGRLLITLLPDGALSSEEAKTKAAEARADTLTAELNSLRQEAGAAAAMAEPAPKAGSSMDRAQASRLISRVKAVLAPIESACSGAGGGIGLEHARTLAAMVAAMSGSIPLPPSMAASGGLQSSGGGRGAAQLGARVAANVAVSGCSPTVAGGMAGRRAASSHVPDFYAAWVGEKMSSGKGERGANASLNGKASAGLSVLGGRTNGQDAPSRVSEEPSVANGTSPQPGLRRLRSGIANLCSPSPTRTVRAAACCAVQASADLSGLVACRGGHSGCGGGGSRDNIGSGAQNQASDAIIHNGPDGGIGVGSDSGNRMGTAAAACDFVEISQTAQSSPRSDCGELTLEKDGCGGSEPTQPPHFGTEGAAELLSGYALVQTAGEMVTSQVDALATGQKATREATLSCSASACSEIGVDKVGIAARRAEAPLWKFDAGASTESGSGVPDLGAAARFPRSSLTLTVPSASKSSVSAEKIYSVARVRSASVLRPVLRENRGGRASAEQAALVKVASLSALRLITHQQSSAERPSSASILGAAAPQFVRQERQERRDQAQTAASAPRTTAFCLPGSISSRPNAAGCLTSGPRPSPFQRQ